MSIESKLAKGEHGMVAIVSPSKRQSHVVKDYVRAIFDVPALKGLKYRLNFGPDFSDFRAGIYVNANSMANGGSTSFA